jgi:hypothetical protein
MEVGKALFLLRFKSASERKYDTIFFLPGSQLLNVESQASTTHRGRNLSALINTGSTGSALISVVLRNGGSDGYQVLTYSRVGLQFILLSFNALGSLRNMEKRSVSNGAFPRAAVAPFS